MEGFAKKLITRNIARTEEVLVWVTRTFPTLMPKNPFNRKKEKRLYNQQL